MSAYRTAIDQTTKTIDTRARYFRNLVVAVVVLTLGSSGWAAVTWTFSPLAGLLLLLPACGHFFFLDAKVLNNWRSKLLDAWRKKDIEFSGFRDAVNAIQMLPKETLKSMLATLPSVGDLVAEQGISSSTREAAALTTTMHACESDAMALKATGFAIVTGSLITAVALWMWQPLLGIIAIALLQVLKKWIGKRRIRILRQRTLDAQRQPEFRQQKYIELANSISCEPLSVSERMNSSIAGAYANPARQCFPKDVPPRINFWPRGRLRAFPERGKRKKGWPLESRARSNDTL